MKIMALLFFLFACTYDDKGNKQDCRRCDCSTSQDSGNHSDYGGKCVHCGAPTR